MRGLKLPGHSPTFAGPSLSKTTTVPKHLASATALIDIHTHQHRITSPRFTVPHHSRSCSIPLITNPSPAYKIFDNLTQRWKAASLPLSTTLSTLLACSNTLTLFTARVLRVVLPLCSRMDHRFRRRSKLCCASSRCGIEEKLDMAARSKLGMPSSKDVPVVPVGLRLPG
jgi:hypothetical protein